MMGTSGEKDTVDYITNFLSQHSLNPKKEGIEWSNGMVRARKIMEVLIGLFMVFFTSSLYFSGPYNGFIPIAGVIVFIGFIVLFVKLLSDDKFEFLGKQTIGYNIICTIGKNIMANLDSPVKSESQNLKKEVYLTAHYDSIASSMPKFSKISLAG